MPRDTLHAYVRPVLPGALHSARAAPRLSEADLCEHAVQAIWRSLDRHDLVDEHIREELALALEPLAALHFGERSQRLIKILRMPDPLDASHLYWLTRRLLTLVPELQAAAAALEAGRQPPSFPS